MTKKEYKILKNCLVAQIEVVSQVIGAAEDNYMKRGNDSLGFERICDITKISMERQKLVGMREIPDLLEFEAINEIDNEIENLDKLYKEWEYAPYK